MVVSVTLLIAAAILIESTSNNRSTVSTQNYERIRPVDYDERSSILCDRNSTLKFRLGDEVTLQISGMLYEKIHNQHYLVPKQIQAKVDDRICESLNGVSNSENLRSCLHDYVPFMFIDDHLLINITKFKVWQCNASGNVSQIITILGSVTMKAIQIGRSNLNLMFPICPIITINNSLVSSAKSFQSRQQQQQQQLVRVCRQKLIVTGPYRMIDRFFNIIVFVLVILVSMVMGALLDINKLIEQIRNPSAIIVGFGTQYLLMPLLAFTITKLFRYPAMQGMGLFVIGCSPGGTNSNQWTVLLDGDIDLSAVLTFISTLSSFVMMPMWLFTLGRHYLKHLNIRIPFLILARNLLLVILPYIAGITVTYFFPIVKQVVKSTVKQLVVLLLLFFIGFGTCVNIHLFRMLKWYHALTAPLLPYIGFCVGAIVSSLCRLGPTKIRTIAIETGFQNIGIAILIIQSNLPSPESEIASVIVIITGMLSSVPLWLFYVIHSLSKQKSQKTNNNNSSHHRVEQVNSNKKLLHTTNKTVLI